MVNTKTVDGEATLDLIAGIRFVGGVPESLTSEWTVRRVVEERPEGAGEPLVQTRRTEVHGTPRAGRVGTPSWRKG